MLDASGLNRYDPQQHENGKDVPGRCVSDRAHNAHNIRKKYCDLTSWTKKELMSVGAEQEEGDMYIEKAARTISTPVPP